MADDNPLLPVEAQRAREGGSNIGGPADTASTGRLSALTYRVGGREYIMRTEPRCHVCTSDYRVVIEDALLRGRGYLAIWRGLPTSVQEHIKVHNIKAHYANGHLPADVSAARVLTEERAKEVGALLDEVEGTLIDHVGALRQTVRIGAERMLAGEVRVGVDQMIQAAKVLADLGMGEGSEIDTNVWRQAIVEMMRAAREVMTPEQFAVYGDSLSQSPVLMAIREKFAASDAKASLGVGG